MSCGCAGNQHKDTIAPFINLMNNNDHILTPVGKNSQFGQLGQTGGTGFTGLCTACSGDLPILGQLIPTDQFCTFTALYNMGVRVGLTGTEVDLSVPSGIVKIDTQRISNALASGGAQLPGGSFEGYITSVVDDVSSSMSSNFKSAFEAIMIAIILMSFFLYFTLITVLWIYDLYDIRIWALLLLLGIVIAAISFVLVLVIAESFATDVESEVSSVSTGILSNLRCALTSSICCYSGATCCCASGNGASCTNPGFPPGTGACGA